MSPNSVNTTVNLMTNSHDAMTKREDGVICVKTDVASASPDKQPDTAISLEKEIMAEETGAKSGASGDEPAVANDDGNMGLVDGSPPAAAADAAAPSNGADDKTPDLLVVPKAVGGAVGEGSIDPLQPQRRASNEERVKLKSSHLRDSSTSVVSGCCYEVEEEYVANYRGINLGWENIIFSLRLPVAFVSYFHVTCQRISPFW